MRQSDIRKMQRGVYLPQPPIKELIDQVSLPRKEMDGQEPGKHPTWIKAD